MMAEYDDKSERYCDPQCGRGCTRTEHDRVLVVAREVASMCGADWTVRVWDNLGWQYQAISPCGRLRVSDNSHPGGDFTQGFTCYISRPGEVAIDWLGKGDGPLDAVHDALTNMMADIGYLFRGGKLLGQTGLLAESENEKVVRISDDDQTDRNNSNAAG